MTDETRKGDPSELPVTSSRRRWSRPRIETVAGREARGSVFSYGGPDSGIYS